MARELLLSARNDVPGFLPARAALRKAAADLRLSELARAQLLAAASACQGFDLLVDTTECLLLFVGDGREQRFSFQNSPTCDELRKSLSASDGERNWIAEIVRGDADLVRGLESAAQKIGQLEMELQETNRGVLALYAELEDRAIRLARADDLKSRFLSYASHELRTPLNGILGLMRLLMARKPQGEDLKELAFIQQAAEGMREMVDDLLDLAKVEAGKITVHPSEFGLELVFGALRGMFRPLLNAGTVELHFEDTSAVPSIYSDETKVVQILRNLISNALKYTERGEVRIWAEFGESEMVRIAVKDTGIGIAPENQTRVFEEFTQIEHPLQRRIKGTGLGLPLCKRLAELLGGRLELDSRQGVGSTFTLVLPRVYGPSDSQAVEQPHRSGPFTVLHVEDEEIDRYLLGRLLRSEGPLRLLHAVDGQAALELVNREHPDLVILDLSLPRISGEDVLALLKSGTKTNSIPVVILTATHFSGEQIPASLNQAIAVLSKDALADAAALEIETGPPVRVSIKS
ncbi:MAG: response regulator [Bryobacterales bacterium]|nr:response regulator [Bryobacterales bacterium]